MKRTDKTRNAAFQEGQRTIRQWRWRSVVESGQNVEERTARRWVCLVQVYDNPVYQDDPVGGELVVNVLCVRDDEIEAK